MVSLRSRLHLAVTQLLLVVPLVVSDTLTVTISQYPGFMDQRGCAFNGPGCLKNGASLEGFGCSTNPLENSCYCRADLMAENVRSISSCVSLKCSGNSVDVQSATSIYLAYCGANGYTAATPTAAPNGGADTSATTGQGPAAATQTAGNSGNSNNGNSGNGNSGGGNGNAACGNGVANVSGVNINCGSRSDGGRSTANQRLPALVLSLALGLGSWILLS